MSTPRSSSKQITPSSDKNTQSKDAAGAMSKDTHDSKLLDNASKNIIQDFLNEFERISKITKENLETIVNRLIDKHKTNFKGIGQPLRIVLTGSRFGPGIYNIILSLNKDVVIKRLKN